MSAIMINSNAAPSIDVFVCDASGVPLTGKVAADFPTIRVSIAGANSSASIGTLSNLAAENSAWAAGGIKERAGSAGWYRLDLPTSVLAGGVGSLVTIYGYSAGFNIVAPLICVSPPVDVNQWRGSTPNALNNGCVESIGPIVRTGTAQAGGVQSITLDAGASATSSFYRFMRVFIVSGTGSGQCDVITSYIGSTKVATVSKGWTVAPDNTSVFAILPAIGDVMSIVGTSFGQLNISNGGLNSCTVTNATGSVFNQWSQTLVDVTQATASVNCSGTFYRSGNLTNNRNRYYNGSGYYIWWDSSNSRWTITTVANLGSLAGGYFYSSTLSGPWTAGGGYTGAPTSIVSGQPDTAEFPKLNLDSNGNPVGSIIRQGTAQAGSSTSITLDSGASSTDNLYRNSFVVILSGTGANQSPRQIASYVGSTKVANVSIAWTVTPDNTSVFAILPMAHCPIDWATIANPGNTQNLNGTTVGFTTRFTLGEILGAFNPTSVPSSTTMTIPSSSLGGDDAIIGCTLKIQNAAGAGQIRTIVAWNDTTRTLTVDRPWITNPTTGSLCYIFLSQSPAVDASGRVKADLRSILGTTLNETVAGYLAAGFKKLYDVASPIFTLGSSNQTGDSYARIGAPAGASISADLATNLAAILNVQNGTFISAAIPAAIERPDSGSRSIPIVVVFSDETGQAKNLDAGNPTIVLTNDAGADLSGRLGSWTNPATGKYVRNYTSSPTDDLEGLTWEITGTVNAKLRRYPFHTEIVDTTAVDFTSSDRSIINAIKTKTDNLPADPASEANATSNKSTVTTAVDDAKDEILSALGGGGSGVVLAADQPNYAPAIAGDAMALTPEERTALRAALVGSVITIRGPVEFDDDDCPVITICQGNDYSADDDRAIEFDLDGSELPDLTGSSPWICLDSGKGGKIFVAGTVPTPTGDVRKIRFEPDHDDTVDLKLTAEGQFYTTIILAESEREISPLDARGRLVVKAGKYS